MKDEPEVVHGFCLSALQREGEAHGFDLQSILLNEDGASSMHDFEALTSVSLGGRLHAVHDRGMVDILFARRCFRIFMSSFPHVGSLVDQLMECPDTTVSCIGDTGPSLEYLAFLSALKEYRWRDIPLAVVKELNIITWWKEWRHTTDAFLGLLKERTDPREEVILGLSGGDIPSRVQFLADDGLWGCGTEGEVKEAISNSIVVLMMNPHHKDFEFVPRMKIFFNILKIGALVFFCDTHETVCEIDENVIQRMPGKYLLSPRRVQLELKLTNAVTMYGSLVETSKERTFFVWQKRAFLIDMDSEAPKTTAVQPDDQIVAVHSNTIDAIISQIKRLSEDVAGLLKAVESIKDTSNKNLTNGQEDVQ